MSRNVQFQVLRGTRAQLSTLQGGIDPDTGAAANPLAMGELYFATDTTQIFMGWPGNGSGVIEIGDVTEVNSRLDQLIVLMEAVRRALVVLATSGPNIQAHEMDFDPAMIYAELTNKPVI